IRVMNVRDRGFHRGLLELHSDVAEPARVYLRIPAGLDAHAVRVAAARAFVAGTDADDDAAVRLTIELRRLRFAERRGGPGLPAGPGSSKTATAPINKNQPTMRPFCKPRRRPKRPCQRFVLAIRVPFTLWALVVEHPVGYVSASSVLNRTVEL